MAGRQNREKSLVDRPGSHLRQEGLLVGPGDPIGAKCASSDFRRIIGLFVAMIVIGQFSWKTPESFAEISPAMNKNDGRIGARREEPAIGRRQAAEHSVRRCHCGQSDMDAARPAMCQKTMREGNCGLGLSGASHILNDEEYWPVGERDFFTEELQRCWLVDVGKQRFHTPKGSSPCRNETGLPYSALRYRAGDIAQIAHKFVDQGFAASRRREFEPIAVRAEPIRQDGKTCQGK